jgi:thiazole biosynthesis enzyme
MNPGKMQSNEQNIDETIVTRAIVESYTKEFLEYTNMDVAIVGAGPSGMVAGYYLAKAGIKTAIFERKLSVGGGMWGGGMMFNKIVVQSLGKDILDEFDISYTEFQKGYYVVDSVEAVSALCYKCTTAGTKIFNLVTVEDVMIRENDRISGLVLNWSPVDMARLHVDPVTVKSKYVIDATGHDAEICSYVEGRLKGGLSTENGVVIGEKPMWAEVGERELVANIREFYPGLLATGMAVNAILGLPRMGAIFGGMLLSGKKVAELAIELL